MIRLLVGLGNPGPEYERTRHNAGFWLVDAAAEALKVRLQPERSYFGLYVRTSTAHGPLCLLQPTTFMNLSGKSVASVCRFFKIAPDEVLVAHDELDLMPGHVKLKRGGGHAGHNGLKDIQAQIGSADFWRLRLGIGHPGVKAEVIDYVLRKPPVAEREAIDESIERALRALDLLFAGEMDQALIKIHARPPKPKPAKPQVPELVRSPPANIGEPMP